MSKLFSTKAVAVSSSNVTASIVAYGASPAASAAYLRLAIKADGDFGPSASGKTHSMAASTEQFAGMKAMLNAYRKANATAAEIVALIAKEVGSSVDAAEGAAFGGVIKPIRDGNDNFVVRGNTADGTIYIDIPSTTIAILSSPNTTHKERDAVAPPSKNGKKRLVASSAGYASYLGGTVGLSFNIMTDLDQTLAPADIAAAFGVKVDDPLIAALIGGSAASAAEGGASAAATSAASAAGAATPGSALLRFSAAIRERLAALTEADVTDAVRFVFAAYLKRPSAVGKNPSDILSRIKVDAARGWVITRLVEDAIARHRAEHVIFGGDVADFAGFVPATNDEIIDLFESAAECATVREMVKRSLLDELEASMEAEMEATSPASKKHRGE